MKSFLKRIPRSISIQKKLLKLCLYWTYIEPSYWTVLWQKKRKVVSLSCQPGEHKRHLEIYQLLNSLPFDHFHVCSASFFSPIQCSALPTYRFKKILKKAERTCVLNNPFGDVCNKSSKAVSQKLHLKNVAKLIIY